LRGGWGLYYGRINGTIMINALINTGLSTGQAVSSVPANSTPITVVEMRLLRSFLIFFRLLQLEPRRSITTERFSKPDDSSRRYSG
jgi:hypothetical protein